MATALEAEGWSVFWDRRIPPGRNFEEHLEQEIRSSRAVVVLWSPQSVASAWVKIEAAQGRDSDILIPILIAPANIPFGTATFTPPISVRGDPDSEASSSKSWCGRSSGWLLG